MSEAFRIAVVALRRTLIVSIQVSLTDVLLERLKDDVADRLQGGARGLVLELSGVDLLDSYLSRALRDLALIADVMGVPTIICGMDPTTALTLVEMGLDFSGLRTALDLEDALQGLDAASRARRAPQHEPVPELAWSTS